MKSELTREKLQTRLLLHAVLRGLEHLLACTWQQGCVFILRSSRRCCCSRGGRDSSGGSKVSGSAGRAKR